MEPGSEFQSNTILHVIFHQHEHWEKMKDIIGNGVSCQRCNTRGTKKIWCRVPDRTWKPQISYTANDNMETILKNCEKEVDYGWILPVPIEYIRKIKGVGVITISCATQCIIYGKDHIKVKRQTTHDASFLPPSQ